MTSTYLQRKRSEHGASLLLLVSIIGLAFIVTVAAFLVAASNGQDTARLASAKVDIATREDALMQVILQQTATGTAPNTNTSGVTATPASWTTLMTNAVTTLYSGNGTNGTNGTTYVDPTELAALLPLNPALSGVTPANTGDTGGTSLSIFQGYVQEVPFGGTSPVATLANLDPSYNSVLEPPLMTWSGNTALSAATALTTPQEFFLGSQYTAGTTASVTKLSASHRWGQIIYPNVRFGYKQPGNLFVARRVWWRIPVLYQTAQQTLEDQVGVNRYPSALANYILSIYEIPSQLPISGNAYLQIGTNADGTAWGSGIQVAGSIYGGLIQLSAGTYSGVSSRQQVNVVSPATVNGVAYSATTYSLFDQPGTREQMALTQTPGVAAPVSVAENDGKVLMVPVMPGNQFYMTAPGGQGTESHWDLYARPYYRCRIRIIISGTNPTIFYNSTTGATNSTSPAGAITVTVYSSPDTSSPSPLQDQILGFLDSAATTYTYVQGYSGDSTGKGVPAHIWPSGPTWMNYTSTTAGDRNLLVIDVLNMVKTLGGGTLAQNAPQLYSIYIGSSPTTEPATPFTATDPAVAITDTNDLSSFTSGLSIVCNQTLYLIDSFDQVNVAGGTNPPPTSIYAPQVRYGMSGAVSPVALTGQVSVDPASSAPTPVNPLSLTTGSNTPIPPSSVSAKFSEITDPTLVPPIPRISLMFTIEKERTN
jgi:hypothetical protein